MSPAGSLLQVGRVAFEVSRFDVVGEWCEVEGQWFGVRGRRFMRPALTLVVDGRPTRLLADLADKPWAAEDGEPWRATFPYVIEGGESGGAELTVAPDVTITLPAPERRAGASKRKSPAPRARGAQSRGLRQASGHTLARQLADLRDTEIRLRQQLDRMEAERAETTQRLLEVSGELLEVKHQRDEQSADRDQVAAELESARRELSELAAERDGAVRERDQVAADREATLSVHDETVRATEAAGAARERAQAEREAALEAQRQAVSERDAAIDARDQALTERDAAVSLRDEAVAAREAAVWDREALERTAEQLQSELAEISSAHGAALVMRRAAQAPGAAGDGRSIFLRRTRPGLIPGAITIAVVLVILLAWLFLLRGF